ncbi:hypothetical protein EEB18_016700 [Sphingopyxis sp. OPL5]|uniref:hypothetical protein n=1 Tax=Sphingopyxis sp. OPL5 TaxID=2486273 RepID=UPI00164DCC43|nr:hypothetical protein [Sphingopyxis sp. OPL5]QNO26382.1 hypothetical protein EEB18_016700 [Sphingopyxis sp. OPL5]
MSAASLFFSWKRHALAHDQERRRRPALVPDYLEGYYSTGETTSERTYHIRIAVRNTSDSANAVARIELGISYRLIDGTTVAARIPAAEIQRENDFSVPRLIEAHETVAGWCRFVIDTRF